MMSDSTSDSKYKAGFVGIVGLPNAGKSSLLNFMLNEHLCIVSSKPQATRRRVQGVVTQPDYQIVFVDSPGFITDSRTAMTDYIAREAQKVMKDVDAILLLVPSDLQKSTAMENLIDAVIASKKPFLFCMSKSDVKKSKVTENILFTLSDKGHIGFPISIRKTSRDKLKDVLDKVATLLPEAEAPLFDEELYTTENMRDIAGEMIREQCFELLQQEIPFGLGVNVESFKEDKKITRIEASILVEKENHKGIVIGKAGTMLKKIGEGARKKIEKMLGQKVFLGLHVTHKADWTEKAHTMRDLGYKHE